jgi:hypothetical protein
MAPLIVGSTLTDLGRNSLLAEQMQRDRENAIADMLYRNRLASQAEREGNQDRALRQQAINQDFASRNAFLQEQQRQWNTPNATSLMGFEAQSALARLPYENRTMADADTSTYRNALLDLQRKQLEMQQQAIGSGNMNPWMANTRAGQLYAEDALARQQANERRKRLLEIANAKIKADPARVWATDKGQANAVIESLLAQYPEASELVFDRKNWQFSLPGFKTEAQQQPVAAPAPLNVQTNSPTVNPFNIRGYSFTPIQ